MRHYHITRVLYVVMVAVLISTSLVIFAYSQTIPARADDVLPFIPFGGIEDSVVTNLDPAGALVCPVYTLVTNTDTSGGLPPIFGVFIPAEFPAPTYDYGNLITPGTPIIGGLLPITCPAGNEAGNPIPVFPLFFDGADGPFYLTGTGSL